MAEADRKNARVKGIVIIISGKEIKLSQYADDATFLIVKWLRRIFIRIS